MTLRPPTLADAAFHHALHSDPGAFVHAPGAIQTDEDRNRAELASWIAHRERHGFGYWIVEDATTRRRLGVAGVRVAPEFGGDALNLYYRLAPASHGRGLGRETARLVTAWASEHLPGRPVHAVARLTNTASIATAEAAGLLPDAATGRREAGAGVTPDGSTMGRWVLPTVRAVSAPDAVDPQPLLALWAAVVAAGGAVGFPPEAGPAQIAPTLHRHLEETRRGDAVLVTMHGPGRDDDPAPVVGMAWWQLSQDPLFAHTARLARLMVDPSLHGRNLGRVLLGGLHAVAATLPGVELLRLDHRDGTGLGDFYRRAGWTEVGRYPGLIRVGPGDDRDKVAMMRRVDGAPLHRPAAVHRDTDDPGESTPAGRPDRTPGPTH